MPRSVLVAIGLYAALLTASHVVRRTTPPPVSLDAREQKIEVAAPHGAAVEIAYVDLPAVDVNAGRSLPTILLVHGSPGSGHDLLPLAHALSSHFRVLIPDLPGFGHSTARLPDYSFDAHAAYLRALLDRLHLRRVHLVGFSMGGGVVLRLADAAPTRVASLSLVSAIGVQEMELFGDYHINHLAHAAQLGLVWFISEGTPHFGAFDRLRLLSYARNFYDSDQRPLRRIMSGLAMPVEIVHGTRDPLVPVEAAREHARLLPQSELTLLDTDHFFAMRDSARLAGVVTSFIGRVERGEPSTRATADPARLAAARRPFDPRTIPPLGPVGYLLTVVLLPLATLISEDLACIGAGMLVALGRLGFLSATIACFVGIVAGDLALFAIGRAAGGPVVRRLPKAASCSARAVARATGWIERRGPSAIVLSRFIPGARLPTYLAAGMLGMGVWVYVRAMVIAAALWTPLLVGVAALLTRWGLSDGHLSPATGAVAVCTAMVVPLQAMRSVATRRGRRIVLSWWRRITRWEFWPAWLFYPPIACWIVLLMIRHRSVTVFTAVNPGIPGGGFAGESKIDILQSLTNGGANVAPFVGLLADPEFARQATADAFVGRHGLPLVVKPDKGQRGAGVEIVRDQQKLHARIAESGDALILQAFVPGVEFGVFYARRRDESEGRIISVTEKRFPSVVGDGVRTLDDLILDDARAVALVDVYRRTCRDDLERVVPRDERVALCELGSHCRGAIFLEGRRLVTPALVAAVERAARAFPGFSFGRFDVRAPSLDAFMAGEFTILELNGVTSEPTHIYDPSYGVIHAYRTVAATWRLAFEIGAQHANAGARVWSTRELVRLQGGATVP